MAELAEQFRERLLKMRQATGLHGVNLNDIFYPWINDEGDKILAALRITEAISKENELLHKENVALKQKLVEKK